VVVADSTDPTSAEFDSTTDEVRVVARFAAQHAEDVRPVFELAEALS
jgi:hypothetical protein